MMKQARFWSLNAFMISIFLWIPISIAQEARKIATAQDIAIAFYKTAGIQPPFEEWIKSQKPFSTTPLARRADVMAIEQQKLAKQYQDYSPFKDVLNIKTNVKFLTLSEKNPETEQIEYFAKIDAGQPLTNFYLPYTHHDQNFMIIPKSFDHFEKIPLTKAQYDHIKAIHNPKNFAQLLISLIITQADMNQPYMLDNTPQWLMSANIVAVDIWNTNNQLMWQYTTNGYIPESLKKIQNLHEQNKQRRDLK